MLLEKIGDIFDEVGKCDAICITTNLALRKNNKAIMGAGIAKAARNRYPDIEYRLGRNMLDRPNDLISVIGEDNGSKILSFPTKYVYYEMSSLFLIRNSMLELIRFTINNSLNKVVIPRPGCQNGGLNWTKQVKPLLEKEIPTEHKEKFVFIHKERNESI